MPRPKSLDPRKTVSLSLRTSTLDAIAERAEQHGETVSAYLARRVEANFGQAEPQPEAESAGDTGSASGKVGARKFTPHPKPSRR